MTCKSRVFGSVVLFAVLMPAVCLLMSCYPDYGLTPADYDIVVSLYDTGNNFSAYRSYAMPDSLIRFDSTNANRSFDTQILTEIARNMGNMGYQRILSPDTLFNKPDLILFPRVGEWTATAVSLDYWDYYYPFSPGWQWYYPWYHTATVSSYTPASLVIDIVDLNKSDSANQRFESVWFGIVNALLENTTAVDLRNRITNDINQVFSQSPYLRVN